MGIFITFEGGDGAGKTTQAGLLKSHITAHASGRQVVTFRDPGSTDLGDFIRSYLRNTTETLGEQATFAMMRVPGFPARVEPQAELFLFEAARAQLVHEAIRPALQQNKIVISDRFADSTTAYQGYGRGIDVERVAFLNEITTDGLKPDLTILLDISPEDGLSRLTGALDRMEREPPDFHRRVRKGYLEIAKTEPERFLVLDGMQPEDDLAVRIWERVESLLGAQAAVTT